jgi:hypothetical protein
VCPPPFHYLTFLPFQTNKLKTDRLLSKQQLHTHKINLSKRNPTKPVGKPPHARIFLKPTTLKQALRLASTLSLLLCSSGKVRRRLRNRSQPLSLGRSRNRAGRQRNDLQSPPYLAAAASSKKREAAGTTVGPGTREIQWIRRLPASRLRSAHHPPCQPSSPSFLPTHLSPPLYSRKTLSVGLAKNASRSRSENPGPLYRFFGTFFF